MDEKEEVSKGSKKVKKKSSNKKGISSLSPKMKGIIIAAASLFAVYVALSCYFCNHFYFGTKINNMSVSGKTVAVANDEMKNKVQNYKIVLKERNEKSEEISSDIIKASYTGENEVEKIKNSQSGFGWIASIFGNNDHYISNLVSYNEGDLDNTIEKLSCFKAENIVEPKNASFQYEDGEFKVVDSVKGCKVDKVLLKDTLIKSIEYMKENIDLETESCYIGPKYSEGDKKVNEALTSLNNYLNTKVTYKAGDAELSLDKETINKWLSCDDDMNITFNESKVSDFVKTLAEKFGTVGISRNFKTTNGSQVTVSGGDYGWRVDKEKEKAKIVEAVKNGTEEEREPIYSQKAVTHDGNGIGNTYVEVSLGGQHLWYYKNGQLVTEGDVVTGNTSAGNGTPGGVYSVEYKERNATLVGPGYSTPVSFWMPFNGGIGLHDATWRSSFGGSIYSYSGSHGCVNCPYSLAQTLFNNIDSGTPVICYY